MTNTHPFSVKEILKNAWHNIKGCKWAIIAPLLVVIAITMAVNFIASLLFSLIGFPSVDGSFTEGYSISYLITNIIIEVVTIFLTAPLLAGAQMVALKKVRGETVRSLTGFQYWPLWVQLGTTILIISLAAALINVVFGGLISVSYKVGFWLAIILQILAVLAFIIFYAFYIFSVLFVADKRLHPIKALMSSFGMVRPHWFLVCRVVLCIAIGFIIVALPFLALSIFIWPWVVYIGAAISIVLAIWGLPYFHLLIASVFNKLAV